MLVEETRVSVCPTLTELDITGYNEALDNLPERKATMNVHLTPELEQMIQNKVRTGRYNSASEVMREALRLMDERDQMKEMHKEELRKKIAAGLKSLEEGRFSDGEEFFAKMEAELDEEIRAEDERIAREQGARK